MVNIVYRGSSRDESESMLTSDSAKSHPNSLKNNFKQFYRLNPWMSFMLLVQGMILGSGAMWFWVRNQPCPERLLSSDTPTNFFKKNFDSSSAENPGSLFLANRKCPNEWQRNFGSANLTRASSQGNMDYIVIAGRLTCVLSWNIFSILKHQNPRRVFIITLSSVCESMILPENVHCIDEQTWVPGLTLKSYKQYFDTKMDVVGSRVFWYWQQMLKMGSAFREDLSDDFVLVDADVIFQRPYSYKNPDGKYIFISGGGKTKEYYDPVEEFLGHRLRMPDGRLSSYVSHSMIMNKQFVKANLMKHDSWWKKIIDIVAEKYFKIAGKKDIRPWRVERQRIYGFSEYMWYTSAFIEQHPDRFQESTGTQFIRDKEIKNRFDDFCPTLESMEKVKQDSEDKQNTPIIVWELEHGSISDGSKSEKNKQSLHAPYPDCKASSER